MKPRRRKGATLGLVAVSVLVIIVIGVGCYFLIKLCSGGREVANSTDAGTLNVAKAALRTEAASASVPGGVYQSFLDCLDPAVSGGWNGSTFTDPRISLLTYNRCVAQALLIAINANDAGTATAVANANSVWTDLQTVGTSLSSALQTDNSWRNAAFNQLSTDNNLKMFGNNSLNQTGYKWAYMKAGGSTNVWFSQYTFGHVVDPANPNISFDYPEKTAGVVPGGMYYTGTQTVTYTPNGSSASPYHDLGSNQGNNYQGNNAAYNNAYMAGYQPIQVLGHQFMGVPVFPQQTPHLVHLADFNQSLVNLDPNGFTPPNAFSIATSSKDSKSSAFGGAVSAAIVGASFNGPGGALAALGASGPVGGSGQPTNQFDFVAMLPAGYIQIVNDAPYGGGPGNWGGPGNGENNIFNWELNPAGAKGAGSDGIAIANTSGDAIFFEDSAANNQALQQWADYDSAADKTNWYNSATGSYVTGSLPNYPTVDISQIFVAINGGQSSRPATPQDMLTLTVPISKLNCLTDLIQNNMGYPGQPDKCGTNLNAMSNAYGRSMGSSGNGPTSTAQQYWSNVDAIKEQIIQAFNTPYVSVSAPSGKSGLGAYEVPKTGSTPPAIPWNAGNAPPIEKVSSVMDILNQVGGCASQGCVAKIWERCNQIAPGTSFNDVVALLSSTNIGMGQTLYIQRTDPTNPNSPLTIKSTAPQNAQVQQALNSPLFHLPDGSTGTAEATCDSGAYDLYNGGAGLIDTAVGTSGLGDGKGDNNLHDQPYTVVDGALTATDHANFITSSGYAGMLGRLEFYQTTSGGAAFSRPN